MSRAQGNSRSRAAPRSQPITSARASAGLHQARLSDQGWDVSPKTSVSGRMRTPRRGVCPSPSWFCHGCAALPSLRQFWRCFFWRCRSYSALNWTAIFGHGHDAACLLAAPKAPETTRCCFTLRWRSSSRRNRPAAPRKSIARIGVERKGRATVAKPGRRGADASPRRPHAPEHGRFGESPNLDRKASLMQPCRCARQM